jgi:hypothetical protein
MGLAADPTSPVVAADAAEADAGEADAGEADAGEAAAGEAAAAKRSANADFPDRAPPSTRMIPAVPTVTTMCVLALPNCPPPLGGHRAQVS